jgi:hypothetical protein
VRIESATEICSPYYGAIYSPTSGQARWRCDGTEEATGTVAAGYAVSVSYLAPHQVVFDAY